MCQAIKEIFTPIIVSSDFNQGNHWLELENYQSVLLEQF